MFDEVSIETLRGVSGGLRGDAAMQTLVVFVLQQLQSSLNALSTNLTTTIDQLSKLFSSSSPAAAPAPTAPMSLTPDSLPMIQPLVPPIPVS